MHEITQTLQLFKSKGRRIDTSAAPRINLQDNENTWFIEKGSVYLFSVEKRAGVDQGPLHYIETAVGPAMLFPFAKLDNPNCPGVIASTNSTTTLWCMPSQLYQESLAKQPALRLEYAGFVELIVKLFLSIIPVSQLEEASIYLSPLSVKNGDLGLGEKPTVDTSHAATLALSHGQTLKRTQASPQEKERALWISLTRGKLFLYGDQRAILHSPIPFPLPQQLWLSADDETTVKVISLEEAAELDLWTLLITPFSKVLVTYLLATQLQLEKREELRLKTKTNKEAANIDKAFHQISNVLSPKQARVEETSEDPLVNVCQIIGKFMGIPIKMPKGPLKGDPETKISLIGHSAFRFRKVLLDGDWWKRDCGPLIAFHGAKKEPLALINEVGDSYVMISPETAERTPVDANLAKNLYPEAYSLYAPLSEEVNTGPKIVSFYVKKNYKEFFSIALMAVASALLALFPPVATQQIIDHVIPSSDISLLAQVFIGLVLVAISIGVFHLISGFAILRLEGISSSQLQSALWDRLLKLPTSFFRKFSTGDLISRVNASEQIRSLLSGNALSVIISGFFSFLYLGMMLFYSPALTGLVICITAIHLLVFLYCLLKSTRLQQEIFQLQGTTNGALLQIIQGVGKLRMTGAENRAFAYWSNFFAKSKQLEFEAQSASNVLSTANAMLPAFYAMVIFAGFLVFFESDENPFPGMDLGSFLGFFVAFGAFSAAIYDLVNTGMTLVPIFPLWQRAKPILQEPQEIKLERESIGNLTGKIEIDNVSFRYEPNAALILDGVTIKANPGEFIAFTGYSGCGKSTLIRLLLGFEKPENGAIYYDGKDMQNVDIVDIRRQLGVVLQDDAILSGTIRDNITCGRVFTTEQVEKALELSGFAEDLKDFPMGLHTMFSSSGQTIFGGQRQRLFIARALVGNPKILIFDEATSALDNKTQEEVSKNIESLHVTRIVIAHRLSTVRNADRIYVFEKGRIVDSGTFQELSQRPGLFAEILHRQQL